MLTRHLKGVVGYAQQYVEIAVGYTRHLVDFYQNLNAILKYAWGIARHLSEYSQPTASRLPIPSV